MKRTELHDISPSEVRQNTLLHNRFKLINQVDVKIPDRAASKVEEAHGCSYLTMVMPHGYNPVTFNAITAGGAVVPAVPGRNE